MKPFASRRFVRFPILLITALCALAAHAQETILDNTGAAYALTGTWKHSTAVAGYYGANYDTRLPGPSPDALVVDNGSAGFSTLGTWKASTAIAGYVGRNYQHHFANGEPPTAIVVDNLQGTANGSWNSSTSVGGYYASNYQFAAAGTGTKQFDWALPVTASGNYDVYARWTAHANRASNAAYTVNHDGGSTVITVNQKSNGGQWVLLGNFALDPANSPSVTLSDQANGYVIADAVMAVPEGASPNTATWALGVSIPGSYNVYARWTAHANRASNAAYTVTHDGGSTVVNVNQQSNGGQWNLLGSFVLDPANSPNVSITDQANGYVIADAVMAVPANAAPNGAQWTIPAGTYEVYARWTAHPNRATNAPYTINHAQGSSLFTANQQSNGAQWNLLGSFTFGAGGNVTLTDEADGYVVADAIRLVSLAPAQAQTYFIHADHLNSPRVITDANQIIVWRWDNEDPFGATIASEDPDGNGLTVTCNLRFPGQYFDKETGNHYNFFRDYEPETGRYIESDSIGLRGGLNTYAYVAGNPLSANDPWGLETCVLVTRNALGFGTHSSLYLSRGSDSGGPVIYDPSGSYSRSSTRGGAEGDLLYGSKADLQKYADFYKNFDSNTTDTVCKDTSKDEEKRLYERALSQGAQSGPTCAIAVSNVISGSPNFPGVESGTLFPGNLFRAAK